MTAPYPPPPSPFAPLPSAAENRGWFSRHWLACLGCGCLTAMGLGVAAILVFVFLVFAAIKQSDVYQESLRIVAASPAAQAELGAPISEGWWVLGNINVNNGSGEADLRYPVSGPKAEGMVAVTATRRNSVWHLQSFALEVAGKRVDLLQGSGASGQ